MTNEKRKIKLECLHEELDQVMEDLKKNNYSNPFKKIVDDREPLTAFDKKQIELNAKQNVNEFLDKYSIKKLKN